VITPKGDMISTMNILEEGYILEDVFEKQSTTLYSVIGNAFVYALMLGFAVLLALEKLFAKNKMK
jgi:apolipoprotein N-acyltransferase